MGWAKFSSSIIPAVQYVVVLKQHLSYSDSNTQDRQKHKNKDLAGHTTTCTKTLVSVLNNWHEAMYLLVHEREVVL